jgi:deoxyribonuclease-4
LGTEEAEAFRRERDACGVRFSVAHDSYLINLASPDPELRRRSERAFQAELQRSAALGLDAVVTHPGNATDGGREAAIRRNAEAIAAALAAVPGPRVLVETTAGTGTTLGWRFEELAALIDAVPSPGRERVGVCLDTAHVFAAGYDLRSDAPGVLDALERSVGPGRLMLLHVNDSAAPLGSRRDRHAGLGSGEIGLDGLGAFLSDPRVARVPRVLETPKGDDPEAADRRNLSLLRGLASRAR